MFARISRQSLQSILQRMDAALEAQEDAPRQVLCVFGAAAILLYGSDERQTQDIDVWRSASAINDRAIEEMARHANIDINPTELQPEKVYLQIVTDGVVRLPPFSKSAAAWPGGQPSEVLWEGRKLTIVAPPPEIVAAAKMAQAEPQDIEDVFYIMAKRGISLEQFSNALVHFPAQARDQATENLVYLTVATDRGNPPRPKRPKETRE